MSNFFELMNFETDPINGNLRLKYGSGPDDPLPFILTLTPSYVARAMQQIMPIPLQDVVDYARRNKERLRIVAQLAKWEGLYIQVLE
jgi:hypothetical protein